MKRYTKTFLILCICTMLAAILCLPAAAIASEFEEDPVIEAERTFSLDDVKFTFKYTSDSVVSEGLVVKSYTDPVSGQSGLELVPEFGLGYAIYDNPDTEIIDGIRINGNEVTSLRLPYNDSFVTSYEVAIKTVYLDTAAGSLAQILDGTYDYSQLITNPVIIFQIIYWGFMALSGIFGLIFLIRNKGIKVKTSDEIASKVTEGTAAFKAEILEAVTTMVREEILPLAQASVNSGKEAVKAIVLSNSNSKDAPLHLLDVFKNSEDISIEGLVESVRDSVLQAMSDKESKKSENLAELNNIANRVIQEDVENATESETRTQTKSIF